MFTPFSVFFFSSRRRHTRWTGDWSSDVCSSDLAGFILGEDQPLGIEAMTAQMMVRQLVEDVAWGELDFLVVDLPPGTADIQQVLVRAVPLTGALIVVTPQYVAHLDARKA